MAHPQRKPRYESLASEALARRKSPADAHAPSEVTRTDGQGRGIRHEDEEIVQIATYDRGWASTALVGLVFVGIIGVAVRFVGLMTTIVGMLVIVGALVWLMGGTLGETTKPWKLGD